MVNKSEEIIRKRYEQIGFTVIHKGAPDFLIFQRNERGTMINVLFVEVKNTIYENLTDGQKVWKEALETLFCEYKHLTPEHDLQPYEYKKEFAHFTCRHCSKDMDVAKSNVLSELRKMRGIDKPLI